MSDKCIVHGCLNHKNQGEFLGDLCMPCYDMITSGEIKYGGTFVHKLRDRIEELSNCVAVLEAKLFTCATDLDTYMNAHAALEAKLAQQDDLIKERGDEVQAAVAAALREAADAVEDYCSDAPDLAGHGHSGAIRDVITAICKGSNERSEERVMTDISTIVITDVVEHEDGSATYTFDIDEASQKKVIELGLEFILTCAAYGLDIQDALNLISNYGKEKADESLALPTDEAHHT